MFASDPQPPLNEVVVEGKALATAALAPLPLASSVIAFEQGQLSHAPQRNLEELLRGAGGVVMVKGGEGRGSELQIRGASSGQGVITFDGIPLLSPFPGLSALDAFPIEALGDVVVVRGPDAISRVGQGLGGSVHLSSRQADTVTARVTSEGGSFGLLRGVAALGSGSPGHGLAATLARLDYLDGIPHAPPDQGNPENDPQTSTLGTARWESPLAANAQGFGSVLIKDGRYSADIQTLGPDQRPLVIDDPGAQLFERLWLIQQSVTGSGDGWEGLMRVAWTHQEIDASLANIDFGVESQMGVLHLENRHALGQSACRICPELTWGMELRHEQARGDSSIQAGAGRDSRLFASGFAGLGATLGRMAFDLGVRVEAVRPYGTRILSRAAWSWMAIDGLRFRGLLGSGFHAPGLGERLLPLLGSPQLQPERGWSAELGVDWAPSSTTHIALTGFHADRHDLSATVVGPFGFYTYVTLPRGLTQGVELQVTQALNDLTDLGVDYTFQDSRDPDSRLAIPLRPKHSLRVFGEWRPLASRLLLRGTVHWRESFFNDPANRILSEPRTLVSAYAEYAAWLHTALYVRLENLTDNQTAEAVGQFSPGTAAYGGIRIEVP